MHFLEEIFAVLDIPFVQPCRTFHLELQGKAFGIFIVVGQDLAQPWLVQKAGSQCLRDIDLMNPDDKVPGIVESHVISRIVNQHVF